MELIRSAESPFTNHLVLKEIAKHLPVEDLMEMRLVNKLCYLTFSDRIVLKFENYEEYLRFLLFHQYKREDSLGMPYKKFNFQNWPDMKTDNDSLPILIFTHLSELTNIRQLTLSNLPHSFSNVEQILRMLSATLEYLKIKLTFTAAVSVRSLGSEAQNEFSLTNLKHLHLDEINYRENKDEKLSAKNYIQEFFKIVLKNSFMTEITIEDSWNILSILEALMKQKPRNLQKVNILNVEDHILAEDKSNSRKLIEFAKEFKGIQITFFGIKFSSSEMVDFLNIYYDGNEKLFKNVQLKSVKTLGIMGESVFRSRFISFEKCLFHFPKIKKISICDYFAEIKFDEERMHGDDHLYEELIEIKLYSELFNTYSESIRNFSCFPNLTKLNLKVDSASSFEIVSIFQNLTKLKELTLDYIDEVITETDLIGIFPEFIKKNLLGKSLKFLQNKNPKRNHPGITAMKHLEKLILTIKEAPTEMSLFFGFRFLPKLKNLEIHGNFEDKRNMHENTFLAGKTWKDEYWNIFLTEFKELESLIVYSEYNYYNDDPEFEELKINNNKYYDKLKVERPLLSIQIFQEKHFTQDSESDSSD